MAGFIIIERLSGVSWSPSRFKRAFIVGQRCRMVYLKEDTGPVGVFGELAAPKIRIEAV